MKTEIGIAIFHTGYWYAEIVDSGEMIFLGSHPELCYPRDENRRIKIKIHPNPKRNTERYAEFIDFEQPDEFTNFWDNI